MDGHETLAVSSSKGGVLVNHAPSNIKIVLENCPRLWSQATLAHTPEAPRLGQVRYC